MTAPAMAVDTLAKPPIPSELRGECEGDPVLYSREVLGVEPWARQADALYLLSDVARGKRGAAREFAIRSGNGVGKSFILAVGASYWFDIVRGSCFITSPTQRQNLQLFSYLRGLRLAARYALPGDCLGTVVRASDSWWIKTITARTDVAFQGLHAFSADGRNRPRMLGLVEEASGVASAMFPAIRGCVTGDHDVLGMIGNPNTASGDFAESFKPGSGVATMTISALESPNVKAGRECVAGLVSKRFTDGVAKRYGKDSDVYRVRVLGLPPKNDAGAIIPVSVWEAARARASEAETKYEGLPPLRGNLRAGLDPGGRDDAVGFVVRDDRRIRECRKWSGEHTVTIREAEAWLSENPAGVLAIDAGGSGAAIADVLLERFGARVVAVQFGGLPLGDEEDDYLQATASSERVHRYRDRRTEIWFGTREWLSAAGEIGAEVEPELLEELEADLMAPRCRPEAKGQLWMESKDQTRKRLGRSPDLGDALALACAADLVEETCSAGAPTVGAGPGGKRPGLWVPDTARGGYQQVPFGRKFAVPWRGGR